MVPRFARLGRSFSGVAKYLLHDAGHAKTSERVAWTHTLNCANDEPNAAIGEMIGLWRRAEALKAEAGLRGNASAKPVKHLSLNWHPSEVPDKEAMIAAATGFLKAMGWESQQAVLIAHTDRAHRHVHVVLSAIDPETGAHINDRHEFRRAQKWAAQYERERGQEFCPQRTKPKAERDAAPPRPVWQVLEESMGAHRLAELAALEGAQSRAEAARGEALDLEWTALKQLQREEREAFFAGGRAVYGAVRDAVYRSVRTELRGAWRDLYAAAGAGADRAALDAAKEALIERQVTMIRAGVDAACAPLRQERDLAYRALLDDQRAARAELHVQQARGEPAAGTLGALAEKQRARYASALGHIRADNASRAAEMPPEQAARWTERGGMVAQQRSAQRWLERVAARTSVESKPGSGARRFLRSLRTTPKEAVEPKGHDGPEQGPD